MTIENTPLWLLLTMAKSRLFDRWCSEKGQISWDLSLRPLWSATRVISAVSVGTPIFSDVPADNSATM
ncbi:hypothetical protein [Sphingobium sp. EM0848]|uniref:hypothetical protein n=1 Tax=Sphingobium sp. EM0848 TaxID=2743473 RepID=UPI00159C7D16|nr:hypothetical protein [Sphingobium sp. EM0848]